MQYDSPQPHDLAIDPQLLNMGEHLHPNTGGRTTSPLCPNTPWTRPRVAMQEAEAWLDNMANTEWITGPEEEEPSPLTSMATDTNTAQGTIYKGCRCPEHQDIYSNWPTQDAELTVALCMKVCVYCGKDYEITAELRKHMRKKYAKHNLNVVHETRGKHSSAIPGWTRLATSSGRPEPRATRSQSLTYGASTATTEMLGHQELRILQYNVQKSRDIVLASLFRNPRVLEYDVLAIQEPWRNPFINTTYHPLKTHFQLAYLDDKSTRVCFYINKRIDLGAWSVTHASKDIASLEIRNPNSGKRLHIINVYNEVGTDTLETLADMMAAPEPDRDVVVLGDFNLHHPSGRQHIDGQAKDPVPNHSSRS